MRTNPEGLNMSHPKVTGILAAITTPFTADGSAIDESNFKAQIDRLADAGIHGIVPTGTTGEFMTLSPSEYRSVFELAVELAAGRMLVFPGVGALSTKEAIALAQHAEKSGADGIMLLPPFYDAPSFEALKVFMRSVGESINIPIMYYNVPGATGVRLNAEEIGALGSIPNVKYLKDTSGDAVTMTDLLFNRSDQIKAFNGWDTLTFMGLASGAEASVWGTAGIIPELAVELWNTLAVNKDLVAGRELWKKIWPICDFLESVNYVAGIKAGLDLTGNSAGPARPPVLPLDSTQLAHFKKLLEAAGVKTV